MDIAEIDYKIAVARNDQNELEEMKLLNQKQSLSVMLEDCCDQRNNLRQNDNPTMNDSKILDSDSVKNSKMEARFESVSLGSTFQSWRCNRIRNRCPRGCTI